MTKIDIFSGFLGAGKTTLIKKLISEAYAGEKLVLIENEFGEIGIDGGFLAEAGIQINEMNSGCICCSLVGDFSAALTKVLNEYNPDRVLIEPSGVGKLSDVIQAVKNAIEGNPDACLNSYTTVVDAGKCKMYMKNFGEFFNDQVANASCIVLSHTDKLAEEKVADAVARLTAHNETAIFVTTPWDQLNGADLLAAMERKDTLESELARLTEEAHHHHHHHDHDEECHCHDHEHEHHHHHHEDGEECHCHDHEHEHHHHHHDHDEECHCHDHDHEHHHHHEDGEECHCHDHEHEHHHHHQEDGEECHCHDHEHEHHHHHDHDGECCCGHHHHDGEHHHHHHADEVFISCGAETVVKFDKADMAAKLSELTNEEKYGIVLRAKGIVAATEGTEWIHFDYVPGEPDVRHGAPAVIGRLCVIGSKLNLDALSELFGVTLA